MFAQQTNRLQYGGSLSIRIYGYCLVTTLTFSSAAELFANTDTQW